MNLVDYESRPEQLTIFLKGHIDSNNSPEVETRILEILQEEPNKPLVLDLSELEYISSAGLRIILRLRKDRDDLKVIEVNPEVYEIFSMTGFTEMMEVEKAYRRISVDGCEVIGKGANGVVYRIDPDTIVKVYSHANALSEIKQERELARKAFVKGIPTAISYDVVRVGDYFGSVFELLNAESFAKILIQEPDRFDEVVKMSADLLLKIHSTTLQPGELPDIQAEKIHLAGISDQEFSLDLIRYLRGSSLYSGTLSADMQSFVRIDKKSVILDTVKLAEDGSGDLILRFYESLKAPGKAVISTSFAGEAWNTDLLENKGDSIENKGGSFTLDFRAFEIKTVRIRP